VQLDSALALFFSYGVKAESGEVEQTLALDPEILKLLPY